MPTPDVAGVPARQGVRQQRPVQPDVFHGRTPRPVSAEPRGDRACRAQDIIDQLRLLHRGLVRAVPLRHVRGRVPARVAERRLRRLPHPAVPADGRHQGGVGRARPEVHRRLRHGRAQRAQLRRRPATTSAIRSGRSKCTNGETDRVFDECDGRADERRCATAACSDLSKRRRRWLAKRLARSATSRGTPTRWARSVDHLYGGHTAELLREARERLGAIEVDRLRVKPIVKVTGEFWAQTTEGDGNFRMFQFLEREGAQVMVEPIAHVGHVHAVAGQGHARRTASGSTRRSRSLGAEQARTADELKFRQKQMSFEIGEALLRAPLPPRRRSARRHRTPAAQHAKSSPRSRSPTTTVSRGAAKATWKWRRTSTTRSTRRRHMVLSLKPFGCMPSTQSDGASRP